MPVDEKDLRIRGPLVSASTSTNLSYDVKLTAVASPRAATSGPFTGQCDRRPPNSRSTARSTAVSEGLRALERAWRRHRRPLRSGHAGRYRARIHRGNGARRRQHPGPRITTPCIGNVVARNGDYAEGPRRDRSCRNPAALCSMTTFVCHDRSGYESHEGRPRPGDRHRTRTTSPSVQRVRVLGNFRPDPVTDHGRPGCRGPGRSMRTNGRVRLKIRRIVSGTGERSHPRPVER